MTTLQQVELGVLGPLQVRQYGLPVTIPGAKSRAVLTMLGLHGGSVVSADTLVELLWGADPPRTAAKALQTHISSLRRALGDGFVLTAGTGWTLSTTEIDASRYTTAVKMGRDAVAAEDTSQAVAHFDEALTLWRGPPELPDGPRGVSEKTRWIEGHAALVEDRADALLATGRAAEIIGELEAAVADAPLRERRWGQLMLALYRAGRQGEALGAYQRARSLLADELGVDPGPDLRRLEAAIVAQDAALETPVSQHLPSVTRAVTFLLTDIEGSTAAWEADADAMAVALARHDEIVEQVVTSRGGRLIKTRGEGDATFSVFDRPSAAAAAAIELQGAIVHEPWALPEPMRIRVALHTGEVELRDGDYFGRAVNRAARLRSLAAGGQILCSGATAELVIDTLADDVMLADLGMRQLRNLARPEHVFELRLETADDSRAPETDEPMPRPELPAVLAGPGPFVGRGRELERLLAAWQTTLDAGTRAVLIAGEPGVGKTRLAGEWCRQAYEQGAVVLYGRCDEDLGAPYQPFAEALRSLVPCLGPTRLRGLRGVEALLPLVPGLTDDLPDLAARPRADADTERYALFDAVVALMGIASASAPVVLVLDDLHWAAKPTLLLLRHLLRFGEHARVQIVGTYRSTDLDRSHPLAAMLADLHRDGSAHRLALGGLDEDDVTTYVAEAGYDDEELARALASVTGGNPFFLIEALRHVDESGGHWDPSTLPQGVREAVSRRLSRLPAETNKALAAAAVVGSRFAVDLVERVVDGDLVDAFDEACKAGIVIEEPGGRYRFNHAIVRQSLLAELASVRRMRLHQRIATTLETEPGADDELLAELAYHYFECAWAGNAAKAVDYCRRAADQAMARLAYEGAADLYDRAVHALEEIDDELPDRDDQQAELLVARCEALLAAGDVVSARGAVSQLQETAGDSARLIAWGTCFDGQLSMLVDPEHLDEIESAVAAAAEKLAALEDAAGEAKAHTVRATCLGRLGRIGDCETALDQALTAARRAGEHRRVNGVLANAPLAALWGPNPVPRAGGRCLDVVRLLRITTGSPVVEATSTRCQGVLDAFRGRAAAGRQLIDSARRTLTELGMRHALLEVEQFAGIVELVADDPAAAEPYLRRAYNGFRRMGLDADTAETAALLARACLALDRDAEADELCRESERLAGHALKASITWRTVRAQLLARQGDHEEARRVAEEAVALAGRTDALVDHGDACLALATVLDAAGDTAGGRVAAERAVGLYEQKGAAALAEKARRILGERDLPTAPAPPEEPIEEMNNACVQALRRLDAAFDRQAWGELEDQVAPVVTIESRRKIVGMPRNELPSDEWVRGARGYPAIDAVRHRHVVVAVRGDRLALTRLEIGTADVSPGAPRDELLQLFGLDDQGRIALQVWFDFDDIDAGIEELDALHARFEAQPSRALLENTATRADDRFNALFAERRWDDAAELWAEDVRVEDRRRILRREDSYDRATGVVEIQAMADLGVATMTSHVAAIRGDRLALLRTRYSGRDRRPDAFHTELLRVTEVGADERCVATVAFDPDDIDGAIAELDARYLAGEAAPYSLSWQTLMDALGELNRHEMGPTLAGLTYADHRRIPFAPGDFGRAIEDLWALVPNARYRATAVHALDAHGAVISLVIEGTDTHGNELQWARILSWVYDDARVEVYEEDDLNAALARFEELRPQKRLLENAAHRVLERYLAHFTVRDWDAMAEALADDFSADDRRRVVNSGARRGRDAEVANMQAIAEIGCMAIPSAPIATRGERLVLARHSFSTREWPEAFDNETIDVIEINADNKIVALISFGSDDLDAAVTELDARYLAGEAAPYAEAWRTIMDGGHALNRHEPGAMTEQIDAFADHRRIPFAADDIGQATDELWALVPDAHYRVAAVHALDTHGAVINLVIEGTNAHGDELHWSGTDVISFVSGQTRLEVYEENDLDAALARFEELRPQTRRLENAAIRVLDRYLACFPARDWDTMAEVLADDIAADDRRRVVNAGFRRGRDRHMADMRAAAEVGAESITVSVIATRGERVALARVCTSNRGLPADEFGAEMLGIVEINADTRIAAEIAFDLDDIDTAFDELDARYLSGEAAAHSQTWSTVMQGYAALNRREIPATTSDWESVDHSRGTAFTPGELTAWIRAAWDLTTDIRFHIEAVHRLSVLGAVVTHVANGTSHEGFDVEWRRIALFTFEGDLLSRVELFEEVDVDAAIARFDELHTQTQPLENAASQVAERYWTHFASGDWDAVADTVAADVSVDDRRRVVNAGIRQGRDSHIEDVRAAADVGFSNVTSAVIATRGAHLVLTRARYSIRDKRPEAFHNEVLHVGETDADDRLAAVVVFDVDDIDAALEELDARYLAGEAGPHAHTWSVITDAYEALNRRELPPTTPDWVNIDHQQVTTVAPGDFIANIRASWEIAPELRIDIESVHRLSDLGAVVTHAGHGTSRAGFDAEWRTISLYTVEGDLINRCELFGEADIDAAIARFDVLHTRTQPLDNAANQVAERVWMYFAARDWDAVAEMLSDDASNEDRRPMVGSGFRRGRDAQIADMRAIVDIGITTVTSAIIATRGRSLVLRRTRFSGQDRQTEAALLNEILDVVEIDYDERIAAVVMFGPDDLDSAFEELDARYLAGGAAEYAHTWSVIAGTYTALNRHELSPTTPDWVNVDHRHGAPFAPGDLIAYLRASWDQLPDMSFRIEAVHRLSDLGAVYTQVMKGTSHEGFDAEWRLVEIMTVEGELISRAEIFDEADIDAALAKFDELSRPASRLENAACRVFDRFRAYFASRDWTAMREVLAQDLCNDDRRAVVGAGVLQGRDIDIAHMQAIADVGAKTIASTIIATRGQRLIMSRILFSGNDQGSEAFQTELLGIVEIDADQRIRARLSFDPDDVGAAFAELDSRYAAGEAAAHAHTWSVVAKATAAVNRQEISPTTPHWVNIDHRRATAFASGEAIANIRTWWDLTSEAKAYIEAVHRLSNLGAVVSYSATGTSQEGFDAEWRLVEILGIEGDLFNRCEIFDETDLDVALARFDELSDPPPQLQNAASRRYVQFNAHLAARDWDGMTEMLADDVCDDDRRRVISGGIQRGRDAQIANLRTVVDVGVRNIDLVVIATRGERLALSRARVSGGDQQVEAFGLEMLSIVEIDTDDRIAAGISFDIDDIDAAFDELDIRYLAGEAADHAHTWSVIARAYAALNRHEMYTTTPDWVNIDHRRALAFAPGDLVQYVQASWSQVPDISYRIEAVHRLSDLGAVYTQVLKGSSQQGFDAEWRLVQVMTVEGDLISRAEIFDEADIDAALEKFDELSRPAQGLGNAASKANDRYDACFAARDWETMAETLAVNHCSDDRRRVVNGGIRHGRDAEVVNMRAIARIGVANAKSIVIATRGERLALSRSRFTGRDRQPQAFQIEILDIVEIDAVDRIAARVAFDLDDIDAAFKELDARYLAGEAAAYGRTWSLVAQTYAALNRHELPPTSPEWVNLDHRRGIAFAPGDAIGYIRASWDLTPDLTIHIEAVHRLSKLGAVVTHAAHGTSRENFDAEWRDVSFFTFDGDKINRFEVFDNADLAAALARFDELSQSASAVENAATQTWARLINTLNRRDVDGFLAGITTDGRLDDRRKGLRAVMEGDQRQRAFRELFALPSSWQLELEPIAIRGSRLVLTHERSRDTEDVDGPITIELLTVVEVADDGLVRDTVSFDPDDIDAAFEELENRYISGEAAAHAQTWSVISRAHAALHRRELPAMTTDCKIIDHRPLAMIEAIDLTAYFDVDLSPEFGICITEVHRLTDLGAVVTWAAQGTSERGFDAEWRLVSILIIDGDLISRSELFDEADIDAALARFDELNASSPQLENAATRVRARQVDAINRRDVDGFVALTTADGRYEDRRKGLRDDGPLREAARAVIETLPLAWRGETEPVAIRGSHLGLTRDTYRDISEADQPITAERLVLAEVSDDGLMRRGVLFDPHDINGAMAELTARWIASGEVANPEVIEMARQMNEAYNRHDWVAVATHEADATYVNHRQLTSGDTETIGDHWQSIRALASLIPDLWVELAEILTHSAAGLANSVVVKGTTTAGVAIELPAITLLLFDGDRVTRMEAFDLHQRELALARFEELNRPTTQLENAATQIWPRLTDAFNRHNVNDVVALITADGRIDDRRKVLRAAHEGSERLKAVRALVDDLPQSWQMANDLVAIRGSRLSLIRQTYRDTAEADRPITGEALTVTEVSDDGRARDVVIFDPDDIDSAFRELTARWIASGEVAHPEVVEREHRLVEAANRHDWGAFAEISAGATYVNHRQLAANGVHTIAAHMSSIQTMASLVPDMRMEIAEVLAHSASAVMTHMIVKGTSTEGVVMELPLFVIDIHDGEHVTHMETFDIEQRAQAFARFKELCQPA